MAGLRAASSAGRRKPRRPCSRRHTDPMNQLIFLTAFLGLTLGTQPVRLEVKGDIKAVELRLDGREIATLHAPWQTKIDFGTALLAPPARRHRPRRGRDRACSCGTEDQSFATERGSGDSLRVGCEGAGPARARPLVERRRETAEVVRAADRREDGPARCEISKRAFRRRPLICHIWFRRPSRARRRTSPKRPPSMAAPAIPRAAR